MNRLFYCFLRLLVPRNNKTGRARESQQSARNHLCILFFFLNLRELQKGLASLQFECYKKLK